MNAVTVIGQRLFWSCHVCDHPVSGMSELAIQAAMDDHAERVNRTYDRTDPHFDELHLDAALRA